MAASQGCQLSGKSDDSSGSKADDCDRLRSSRPSGHQQCLPGENGEYVLEPRGSVRSGKWVADGRDQLLARPGAVKQCEKFLSNRVLMPQCLVIQVGNHFVFMIDPTRRSESLGTFAGDGRDGNGHCAQFYQARDIKFCEKQLEWLE